MVSANARRRRNKGRARPENDRLNAIMKAGKRPDQCDRPGCYRECDGDWLYCSVECFELDNDPTPITVLARNKAGGFGRELHWQIPDAVHLPDESEAD